MALYRELKLIFIFVFYSMMLHEVLTSCDNQGYTKPSVLTSVDYNKFINILNTGFKLYIPDPQFIPPSLEGRFSQVRNDEENKFYSPIYIENKLERVINRNDLSNPTQAYRHIENKENILFEKRFGYIKDDKIIPMIQNEYKNIDIQNRIDTTIDPTFTRTTDIDTTSDFEDAGIDDRLSAAAVATLLG